MADSGRASEQAPVRWNAVLGLVGLAFGVIGSWWLATRTLVAEYRPELVGAVRNSDVGYPRVEMVWVTIGLAAIGLGFAVAMVTFARRVPRRTGAVVGAIVAVAVVLVGAWATSRAGARCSYDVYGGGTLCASRPRTLATDLAAIAVPGLLTVACLALGAMWPKGAR